MRYCGRGTFVLGMALFFMVATADAGKALSASPSKLQKGIGVGEYTLIATSKTSTMEKEMNQAAQRGYYFAGLTFGETSFGGKELIVVMRRGEGTKFDYKLLATSKTSTMERELNEAGTQGYRFKESSYGDTAGGGQEVLTVLERSSDNKGKIYDYKLLATSKTSTMQKELNRMSDEGFVFRDVTYGNTAFGGTELISVMEREREP